MVLHLALTSLFSRLSCQLVFTLGGSRLGFFVISIPLQVDASKTFEVVVCLDHSSVESEAKECVV